MSAENHFSEERVLKAFSRGIDRFCARHPNFGIRNLMLFIIIGNAVVYLFCKMDTTRTFIYYLYFNPQLILRGQIWRLITFIFVPADTRLLYFAISLYFYYFIGSTLERYWGTAKFTLYYIFGVLFTMIYGIVAGLLTNSSYLFIDATYINLSMFFAFAVLFPDMRVLLFFFIPIKIKWLAIVDALFFAFRIIFGTFPTNLLPLIALLNFALFFGDSLLRMINSNRVRNNKTSASFRYNVHAAQRAEAQRPYHHKCAVCGKTDTDFPNLQFRYCSKCAGYHCFCEEHINNHVHFTE